MISPIMAHQQPIHLVEESSVDEEAISDEHSVTETSAKEATVASNVTLILAQHETKTVNRSKALTYLAFLLSPLLRVQLRTSS